jgi:hypothetical protein
VGGCELRARLLLEPSEADSAVQVLIDSHEKQLNDAREKMNHAAETASVPAASSAPAEGQGQANGSANDADNSAVSASGAAAATGVLRLVQALRLEELEGQREAVMHDVRCVAARYGDVVDVDIVDLSSTARGGESKQDTVDVGDPQEGQGADGKDSDKGQYRDIVVKYTSCQGADRAAEALQGRMFAQRPLVAVVESC